MWRRVRCCVFSNDLDVNRKVPANEETLVRKYWFPQILRLCPQETIVAKNQFIFCLWKTKNISNFYFRNSLFSQQMFFRLRAEETMLTRFKCRAAQRMGCDRAARPHLSMRKCKGSSDTLEPNRFCLQLMIEFEMFFSFVLQRNTVFHSFARPRNTAGTMSFSRILFPRLRGPLSPQLMFHAFQRFHVRQVVRARINWQDFFHDILNERKEEKRGGVKEFQETYWFEGHLKLKSKVNN